MNINVRKLFSSYCLFNSNFIVHIVLQGVNLKCEKMFSRSPPTMFQLHKKKDYTIDWCAPWSRRWMVFWMRMIISFFSVPWFMIEANFIHNVNCKSDLFRLQKNKMKFGFLTRNNWLWFQGGDTSCAISHLLVYLRTNHRKR